LSEEQLGFPVKALIPQSEFVLQFIIILLTHELEVVPGFKHLSIVLKLLSSH
jgi:hypothetical protein